MKAHDIRRRRARATKRLRAWKWDRGLVALITSMPPHWNIVVHKHRPGIVHLDIESMAYDDSPRRLVVFGDYPRALEGSLP